VFPSSFESSLTFFGTQKNPPGWFLIRIYRNTSAIQLIFYTNRESTLIFGSVAPSPSPTTDCVITRMEDRYAQNPVLGGFPSCNRSVLRAMTAQSLEEESGIIGVFSNELTP
jgi:hypothetical protein